MAFPVIPILSGLFKLGETWLSNKQKKSAAKGERESELIRQTGSWEELHAKGSQTSWKDEYWTLIFSIPLILCFIPSTVEYVMEGFNALDGTPEWYRVILSALVFASIGVRQYDKRQARKRIDKDRR